MSHQLFFLSIFFHCFSLAAEDHPWSPQSFWDKIFSHFAISGPFSQPHSYLAFTLPLPPQTWSFANMTLPFLGAENWGSVWWDRKAHPQGQKTHVWSAVSELFYLNLPMALASWEGLSDTLSPHLSLFDYIVFHCFFLCYHFHGLSVFPPPLIFPLLPFCYSVYLFFSACFPFSTTCSSLDYFFLSWLFLDVSYWTCVCVCFLLPIFFFQGAQEESRSSLLQYKKKSTLF